MGIAEEGLQQRKPGIVFVDELLVGLLGLLGKVRHAWQSKESRANKQLSQSVAPLRESIRARALSRVKKINRQFSHYSTEGVGEKTPNEGINLGVGRLGGAVERVLFPWGGPPGPRPTSPSAWSSYRSA